MLSDPLESNPGKHNHAEIISIGDELLIGQVVNTNASWLAEQLFLSGFMVKRIVAIPDEEQAIFKALDDAVVQAGVVVITGGLGPTADDITKPALCRYFGTDLVFSQLAFEQISELFVRRGWAMNDRNRMQAMLPEACMPLKNSSGTAPGMWFVKDKSIVVSLPGVPFEMQDIFTNELAPRLKQLHTGEVLLYKTILTTGVGESVIADRLSAWESLLPQSFKLAYLPQPGLVRLRLTANGSDAPQLEAELERLKLELVSLLSDIVFGYDGDTVEGVVGQKLAALSKTLSTAESCTGGTIAAMITSVPGSSAYFKGSVVAYANETKGKLLGVDEVLIRKYGSVSREVVEVMASQARALMHTDYAIATSGIAGPDGATPGKPVGTVWIALAGPKGIVTEHYLFGEHRGRNIRRASLAALNLLRKSLDTELISDSES